MIEFGIEWRFKGDTSPGHTSGGYTLAGARSQVANSGDPKRFHPYAARVVERDVSDWRESPCVAGDSAPRKAAPTGKIKGAPRTANVVASAVEPGTACPSSDITGKEPLSS